ncbi:hypothetical protein [uncultured Clostridium sp.]|uniref:hypothetical protein n=1 Tax=uncultured Clostridium sp. TaxID=59620 RepID=UPI0028E866FA|nr:hypothetical protein [uncultured Clostridium sp.]
MITINIKDVVLGIVLGILVHVSFVLSIIIYVTKKHKVSINYDKDLDKFMDNAYHQAKWKKGNIKLVDGFNIVNNTLPFHNITIEPKDEGYCLGYCYFTRAVFERNLPKIIRKYFKEVYNVSFLINAELNIYTINEIRTEKKVKYEVSKNIFEILKAVRYYQRMIENKGLFYKSDGVMPQRYISIKTAVMFHFKYLLSKMRIYRVKIHNKLDLNKFILQKVEANELVMIRMNGYCIERDVGHCVLAYKYEILSDDEVKVFVYDCNIPITYENDVADDVFILFKLINGEWEYLYRPVIDNTDYYKDSNYNSYSQESVIVFS